MVLMFDSDRGSIGWRCVFGESSVTLAAWLVCEKRETRRRDGCHVFRGVEVVGASYTGRAGERRDRGAAPGARILVHLSSVDKSCKVALGQEFLGIFCTFQSVFSSSCCLYYGTFDA